jgi:hypothetical protein
MLLPSVGTWVDVQMAQRASVGRSQWFSRQALLLLNMRLVDLLLHRLLAPGALLVVLAILALSHQMRGEGADLNALSALATNGQHGAGVVVVHIFVVLLDESFVVSFAELAVLVFVVELG